MAGLVYRFWIIVEGKYNIRLLNESMPSTTPIGQSIPIPSRHDKETKVEVRPNPDKKTFEFNIVANFGFWATMNPSTKALSIDP